MTSARLGLLVAACLSGLTGCAHLGPRSVAVDRSGYSESIAESWKQQTLLNIVKLRYVDLPVFVDVSSIVAGYSLETSVTMGGTAYLGGAQADSAVPGASGRYTDRPTITYLPMTGEKFLRGLLMPIDPKSIFSMLQSGYAADFILALTVDSLNGVRNRSTATGMVRAADPEFVRALVLLRDVQAAGALGMRVEQDAARGQTAVLFFRREDVGPDIAAKMVEIRRLLHLADDQPKFSLVYSPVRGAPSELTVSSRSMLQIMMAFSSYIDVPPAHLAANLAVPSVEGREEGAVRIHSGAEAPAGAYVAVRYRGTSFWIEDGDLQTKRALSAVMFFFTLVETGNADRAPLITIPAQ